MRVWNALHGGYSWVITYEPSLPEWSDSDLKWSDSELAMWTGYTATYVRTGDPSRPKIVIEGGTFVRLRRPARLRGTRSERRNEGANAKRASSLTGVDLRNAARPTPG